MKPKERFLTAGEIARLNAELVRDEFWCPNVVAVIRLLLLTGCRVGEILSLEWNWIKDRRVGAPAKRALDDHEARWPEAVAATRLLALTGCHRSEVLDLRWRDIGKDALNLRDSKTGPRAVPLGEAERAHVAGTARFTQAGCAPLSELRPRQGLRVHAQLLARGLRPCEARQPSPA